MTMPSYGNSTLKDFFKTVRRRMLGDLILNIQASVYLIIQKVGLEGPLKSTQA
jgi:hypothetical protein